MPQVSSLPVSRGLQNLVPAPPPSVPPPPDTPVSVVVQRPERSVEKEIQLVVIKDYESAFAAV